jgi:hypothetical protein
LKNLSSIVTVKSSFTGINGFRIHPVPFQGSYSARKQNSKRSAKFVK